MKRTVFNPAHDGSEHNARLPIPCMRPPAAQVSLSPALQHILREVQRDIGYGRVDATEADESTAACEALVSGVAERYGLELTNYERDLVVAQIQKEQRPFGILQDLVEDAEVSDIIISSYSSIAIQQGRRNYQTGLTFPNQEGYEAFVEKLLARSGSSYSTKKPIADGMIGSFARVHAVHASISDAGPYCTIRLNRFASVSVRDLEQNGLAAEELFLYLQAIIQSGRTVLIAGEVGTGKTTLSRALAAKIPPDESILVIEDTPEIKLEHPHVRYMRTREINIDGAGRVTPSECIRGGMRMAMNRIIFGEIRDAEAAEAFVDVCASGHPGLSTIHARSALDTVARLELFLGRAQKGVAQSVLLQQIATAVHVIVHVGICKMTRRRRVMEVVELGAVADGVLRHRTLFRYALLDERAGWSVENRISMYRDALESQLQPVQLSTFPHRIEVPVAHSMRDALGASEVGGRI